MTHAAVIGAQWGDEGKGKIVDLLSEFADVVVRFQGGGNAGHTIIYNNEKVVLNHIPSGVLHEGKICILGQGMVIDPFDVAREIEALRSRDLLKAKEIRVSDRAHVIMPHHKDVDSLREDMSGGLGIGTTRRGVGPAYEDKYGRRGVRVGDLYKPRTLRRLLEVNIAHWRPFFLEQQIEPPDVFELLQRMEEAAEGLKGLVTDTSMLLHRCMREKKHVLLEGAQGCMLDIDHGTYPFVTSSSTVAGGACTGAGIGPREVHTVLGITKAYTTRVGGGPFPTEAAGDSADVLRRKGVEFGATTGRPRRCGWLDIPLLRRAIRLSGIDSLVVTKMDVLSGIKDIPVCIGYLKDGVVLDEPPLDDLELTEPVYERLEGWDDPLKGMKSFDALPASAQAYIRKLEELAGCKVSMISTGPSREETIVLSNPFHPGA